MTTELRDARVREAMERLLTGRAIHAGARLDVVGLALEAGVSRHGNLYRSHRQLLEEFRAHRRRLEASTGATEGQLARLEALRTQLREANARAARYRTERDGARAERDAAASQVAYLDLQNTTLRNQLAVAARLHVLAEGRPVPPPMSPPNPGGSAAANKTTSAASR